nr:MAG TPA: hypothetical protein [Caudoviricetes sp.]
MKFLKLCPFYGTIRVWYKRSFRPLQRVKFNGGALST